MEEFYSQRDLPSEPLATSADLIISAQIIQPNDYTLVVATKTHIKLFSLLEKVSEVELPEAPLKLVPYLFEGNQTVAVAFRSYVAVYGYIGDQLKEISRYNLYFPPISKEENEILKKFIAQEITSFQAATMLKELMQKYALTLLGQRFVSLPDPPASEPYSPQQQPFQGTQNRARLLDGFTQQKDEITALSVVDCSDNQLKTLTGQCLVVGTLNNLLQIIRSDLSGPLLTVFLGNYLTPKFIYMEGVISHGASKTDYMQVKQFAEQTNDSTNQSWRATVLTAGGSVLSVRNGQLSANKIETDSTPTACYRIGKSVFLVFNAPYPASIQKLSVRGRIEMQYELQAECKALIPVDIVLGKPFSGFLVLMEQNHMLFVGENGPAKHIQLTSKYPLESVQICRMSTSDTALVCVAANGAVSYKLIKKMADFGIPQGASALSATAPPFDVEALDNADARFTPFAIDVYQQLAKQFLPARAACRNVILYELLLNAKKGVETTKGLDFVASTVLEGNGPAFQLVVGIKNTSKQQLGPMLCNIISPLLKAEREAIVTPSVYQACDAEVTIALKMQGGPEGYTVDAHEVIVEIGDDGQRALWTGVVCVPEFVY